MTLMVGSILADRYRIDGLLGEGGMGAVYRAWDTRLDQTVALKENLEDPTGRLKRSTDPTVRAQVAKTRERFETEAKILARLRHPGLPQVRDHFVVPGEGQYLVMDYVEGQDLQVLLKQVTRLPEERVVEIGIQVCEILDYLHNQNPPVIHRDIKPANLRMTPEGTVVLVDFGICKEGIGQATKTAARAVSEGFSPIEMYGQYGGTDARSDIYSLGATLLALFTGEALPSPTDRTLGHLLPQLPPTTSNKTTKLHAILEQALALKPEDRYQSAQEMQDALKNLNIENVQVLTSLKGAASSHTSGKRTREVREESGEQTSVQGKTSGSKKWLIVAGGLAIVVVAVFLAVYFSQRPQTSGGARPPDVNMPNQTGLVADSVARTGEQMPTADKQKTEAQTKSLVTFTLNTEAKVKVAGNGEKTEKTGKRVEFSLSKGEYKYSVTAKGFRDETGTIQVDAGHDREILLSLQAAEENNQAKQAGRQPTVDSILSPGLMRNEQTGADQRNPVQSGAKSQGSSASESDQFQEDHSRHDLTGLPRDTEGSITMLPPAAEITAAEIIAKSVAASGGEAAIQSVKTLTVVGNMFSQGMSLGIKTQFVAPDKVLTEVSMGTEVLQSVGVNGKSAWVTTANGTFMLDEKVKESAIKQANIFPLHDYKKRGAKAIFIGDDLVKTAKTLKVEFIEPNGDTTFYDFDATDFRVLQMKSKESTSLLSDYRKVGGLLMPFGLDVRSEMGVSKMVIDSITINTTISNSVFSIPNDAQPYEEYEKLLHRLQGGSKSDKK